MKRHTTEPGTGYRLGLDVGGTFTDIILVDGRDGSLSAVKTLNRQEDRSETVADGVARLLRDTGVSADRLDCISHGTTITTNAVIERKGARTALIANRNFRDILEIGRFARPARLIYRIHEDRPAPLVERHLRLGVGCRIDREGEVVAELDEDDLDEAIAEMARDGVESVAVCFLFSFLNPVHEERVRQRIAAALPGLEIVLSSEILREFREFPRTATTVFAAYVAPTLRRYVSGLLERLRERGVECPLYIFQSNGGVAEPGIAMRNPALTLLSGPAGAVVGAMELCREAGYPDAVTMDMGGTSLDVCLVRSGSAEVTTKREIDMFPVAIPMLDVHTIGAGGGSVVRVDEVGRVKVGPDSMGARPGPACYGLGGDRATLSDAHLLMGLLNPATFSGGEIHLDRTRAERAVREQIAEPLSITTDAAVAGIYQVAVSQIADAVRTVAVERGSDLRDFTLIAFGGGGPLHAAAVAGELGIGRVVVPRFPGLFSAWGIATADFSHDYVQSVVKPVSEVPHGRVDAVLADLSRKAAGDLGAEGIAAEDRDLLPGVDLRYLGQATEITVPLERGAGPGLEAAVTLFHEMHEQQYNYRVPEEPVELVNVRLRAVGRIAAQRPPYRSVQAGDPAPAGRRQVLLPGESGFLALPVYRREDLPGEAVLAGPALIEEASSTTVVPGGMSARIDPSGNIVIEGDRTG